MLKIIWFFAAMALSFDYVKAQSEIEGVWNTGRYNTLVGIQQEKSEWVGKIKSSDNERAVIGKIILKELNKVGKTWTGQLFVAKRQKWFDVELVPDETTMDLVISAGFSKRRVEWLRINE